MKRTDFDALLGTARAADADLEASERIEQALRAAYRRAHQADPIASERPRGFGLRAARDWFWAGLAAAAAAGALLAITRPAAAPPAPIAAEAADEQGFTPLVLGDPWSDVEAVQVVRVEMPRTALAAWGYVRSAPASEEGAAVRADLLVGNDGIARGIRFVR